ncbi:Ran-binding protein 10 [Balamuthia mandrillaris]
MRESESLNESIRSPSRVSIADTTVWRLLPLCLFRGIALDGYTEINAAPGWRAGSYGYHGDDGKLYLESGFGRPWGAPLFTSGDTVGCGVDLRRGDLFFTKNGEFVGVAKRGIKAPFSYFAVCALHSVGAVVRFNFGGSHGRDFAFDIAGHVQTLCAENMEDLLRLDSDIVTSDDAAEALTVDWDNVDPFDDVMRRIAEEGAEEDQDFVEYCRRQLRALRIEGLDVDTMTITDVFRSLTGLAMYLRRAIEENKRWSDVSEVVERPELDEAAFADIFNAQQILADNNQLTASPLVQGILGQLAGFCVYNNDPNPTNEEAEATEAPTETTTTAEDEEEQETPQQVEREDSESGLEKGKEKVNNDRAEDDSDSSDNDDEEEVQRRQPPRKRREETKRDIMIPQDLWDSLDDSGKRAMLIPLLAIPCTEYARAVCRRDLYWVTNLDVLDSDPKIQAILQNYQFDSRMQATRHLTDACNNLGSQINQLKSAVAQAKARHEASKHQSTKRSLLNLFRFGSRNSSSSSPSSSSSNSSATMPISHSPVANLLYHSWRLVSGMFGGSSNTTRARSSSSSSPSSPSSSSSSQTPYNQEEDEK